ncbi:MAG: lysylphosphatidylglycerol synthase transmembrane domain-containing protein [Desulfuromonadaceae bacterium]|nr:lysylphosphatidylglycerol synthase transmembrane domain-containing protein [Desulfuromonadaceae bacterium]MDD2856501.1 lysylphosphatidylglycerol synthase transmembrane domain-containing protein [Desulfuromonadaceae bacterium]
MRNKLDLKFWLGIGVSIFFMTLLFRKIDFNQLLTALLRVDYFYIMLAIALTFLSYFLRAVRWHYILIPEKRIPILSLYPATIIGYMANNLLPARLGEFVRAYILARKEGLQAPTVFASLVIDRLFDGFTVMLILLFTMFTLRLPHGMAEAETVLRTGGLISFILYSCIVIFLLLLKGQTSRTIEWTGILLKPFPQKLADRIIPLLGSFIGGIRLSSKASNLMAILISSLAVWLFCIIPVDLVLKGFDVHLPFTASMFILVLLVFAVMVPASPGYIGTYHYACFKGLSAFGVPESTAVSIALVLHATGFFPVIIAGFYHVWRNKISLNEIKGAETIR